MLRWNMIIKNKVINCRTWSSFMSNFLKGVPCSIKFKEISYGNIGGNGIVNIVLYDNTVVAEYKKDFDYFKKNLVYIVPNDIKLLKSDSEANEFITNHNLKLRKPDDLRFKYSIYSDGKIINDCVLFELINKYLILNSTGYFYHEFLPWYSTNVVDLDY